MASAAVKFPVDKDQAQIPLWPDNEELSSTTSDNFFFDQFLTFDPTDATVAAALSGEGLEDPPSPSILLDSLHDGLTNSSSLDRDLPLDTASHTAQAAEAATLDTTTTTGEPAGIESQSVFSPYHQPENNPPAFPALAADPILSNGSISDSELLRLEGISTTNPVRRGNVTAPSTPLLAPSSVSASSRSPRKHTRFLESLYNTIRRGAHHHRPKFLKKEEPEPLDMTSLDVFLGSDHRSGLDALDVNYDDFAAAPAADSGGIGEEVGVVGVKMESLECHHGLLPLTPPLTGQISPNEWATPSQSGFVSGHLDDPFLDGSGIGGGTLTPSAIIHSAKRRGPTVNTPMDTPMIDGEPAFCHNQNHLMDTTYPHHPPPPPPHHHSHRQPHHSKAYRHHTSSAEWPSEGILTSRKYSEDSVMWSPSTSYLLDTPVTANNPNWWDGPNPLGDEMSSSGSVEPTAVVHHRATGNGGGGVVLHGHAHNIPMQQTDLPYDQGLGIHMPQPRTPHASILSANLAEHGLASPGGPGYNHHHHHHHRLQKTPSHSHLQHPSHPPHYSYKGHGHGHGYYTERRPRPRAPSSGARHHASMATSPRKLHHSMSLGSLREQSISPSPVSLSLSSSRHGQGHGHPHGPATTTHQERRQQRSSSLSMRKQRSFSRRSGSGSMSMSVSVSGGDPGFNNNNNNNRGDGSSSSSSTSAGTGHSAGVNPNGNGSGSSSRGPGGDSGGGGGGGGGGAKFVNFTPNDKKVLMTGVAPSGSSKTKARREKEAEEKRQLLEREAAERLREVEKIKQQLARHAGGDPSVLLALSS